MKILYDHQIFSMQKYGGISRYFFELMQQLNSMPDVQCDLAVKYTDNFYLLNEPGIFEIQETLNNGIFCGGIDFKGRAKLHRLFGRMSIISHPVIENKRLSKRKLQLSDFDVLHPTYYDTYILHTLRNKPFVITVYDMIHEKYSGSFFNKADKVTLQKKQLIKKASHVIAISENTKRDIIDVYGISDDRISVIYLGNSLRPKIPAKNEIALPLNYILYVGDRHSYKNFEFFLQSITPLLKKEKELYLVCAGSKGFSGAECDLIETLGIKKKVTHFPLIDDTILSEMYNRALCFVFPTLYEGFGIPVLEAFACGCPAVLSKTSSLPEVGGDAAIYFDPEDKEDILETVKSVVYNRSLAKSLTLKGYEQLKKFSWEECAMRTKMVYENVI